jgi:hypothetical protein
LPVLRDRRLIFGVPLACVTLSLSVLLGNPFQFGTNNLIFIKLLRFRKTPFNVARLLFAVRELKKDGLELLDEIHVPPLLPPADR